MKCESCKGTGSIIDADTRVIKDCDAVGCKGGRISEGVAMEESGPTPGSDGSTGE